MVETLFDVCYNAGALVYSACGETGLFGVSVHGCIDFVKNILGNSYVQMFLG